MRHHNPSRLRKLLKLKTFKGNETPFVAIAEPARKICTLQRSANANLGTATCAIRRTSLLTSLDLSMLSTGISRSGASSPAQEDRTKTSLKMLPPLENLRREICTGWEHHDHAQDPGQKLAVARL